MSTPSAHEVTQLLRAWSGGDGQALEKLTSLVYEELHRWARHYMAREQPGLTIQTTALVHEVYLRLVDFQGITWQDRAHFLAVCTRMMQRILTDFARSRQFQKRGGGAQGVSFDEHTLVSAEPSADLVALDDALNGLAGVDQRKNQVVELRFFGGLRVRETAEVLKVSEETVKRDWRLAKLWLLQANERGAKLPCHLIAGRRSNGVTRPWRARKISGAHIWTPPARETSDGECQPALGARQSRDRPPVFEDRPRPDFKGRLPDRDAI